MKFGKEFAAQMVQEWQEAYMDYSKLKSILKDILKFKKQNMPPSTMATATATRKGSLKRRATLYRAFSGLTTRSGKEGGEFEMLFFKRLDDGFNKVVKFYKKKDEETMVEADDLSKQMNALISLRIKVDNPLVGGTDKVDLADNGFSSNSSSINGGKHGRTHMDAVQEIEMSSDGISKGGMKEVLIDSLDQLHYMQELRTAEEKISQAFIEFYRKLRLLRSYCFLNQLAFSKIMKKYDEVSLRNASKAYLQMVDKSYLGSSDEVTKLLQGAEETYVKHFANGNRRKGLKTLRPQARKERHRITFLYGFFSGCSIALIVAIIVNIHARNILKSQGRDKHMVNVFPLYSLFGYIVLHMLMCAGNIFFWKRYRVNYSFIFGFKQGTELGYREVLLSSGFSLLALAGVISHLDMEMDPRTKSFRTLTELIPLFLLICLRRLFEEKDTMHGLNGLKYFSTIVAVGTQTIYQHQAEKTTTWLVLAAATSGIATLASLYWDIVIDWGLLNRNSTNPWLRDKLVVPHKGVYFVAMVLNRVLRLAWMQQVLGIQTVPFLHKTALDAAVAGLEIIRRGIWNFFRLENEHLNNVGKYRAFKSVPLPFYYDKNGDKSI
ncbi:EXS family protein isoform 2 [Hibiscus syriacus]|uniref:EXS family protein isoform 2 n=1 Tax=Hibiscus syriacus TaxID=106335 RepID=A0A6A3D5K8_HIBSY|nr:EXS family protein isoform 2 [Hibiscus syriacus]